MSPNVSKQAAAVRRSIRFGVLCEGSTLAEWQVQCLQDLLDLSNVDLGLVIKRVREERDTPRTDEHPYSHTLYRLYSHFVVRPRAFCQADATQLLSRAPHLVCTVNSGAGGWECFKDEEIEAIREYDLDFILQFDSIRLGGGILNATRHGVWAFHHDDPAKYQGTPCCFWEIYNGNSVTGAVLQKLAGQPSCSVILKKGFVKTVAYSYARNIDAIHLKSASWPRQVCVDIQNSVASYLDLPPSKPSGARCSPPRNLQMLAFTVKLLMNRLVREFRSLFRHDQWNLGIAYEPIHAFLRPDSKPAIHPLPPPQRGKFLADPFGMLKDGKLTILCEDYDFRQHRGIISGLQPDGEAIDRVHIAGMELPTHLSYPYLLEHRGEIYCIPESSGLREVSLFRAVDFPQEWTKVSTLLSGVNVADATVFAHQGFWWMTAIAGEEMPPYSNLCIWYAPDLFGPWEPHPANPVKTDVRSARPGGTPFVYGGNLYRPAQDCSRTYGGQIVLNRVMRLTPTEFEEEPVAFVEPEPNSHFRDGLHTLSSVGDITLVDTKRYVFNTSALRRAFILSLRSAMTRWMRTTGKETASAVPKRYPAGPSESHDHL